MEPLFSFQESMLKSVTNDFQRYLHKEINWKARMIGIKGTRGAGKTTLMLQYQKFGLGNPQNALYVTADHTWFYTNSLLDTASDWYKQGGKYLLIDEVHKYPNWSRELKNIYDGYPEMQIIFSASSALDIYRGEADLSRRVISYSLAGLSFREYLELIEGKKFDIISLKDIIDNHRKYSSAVNEQIRPLPLFNNYLKEGYLPIVAEDKDDYIIKLEQIVNTVVEVDLAHISSYNTGTAQKIKKLLGVIAESAPFKPNISEIAGKLDLSRDSVYQYIHQLKNARLLNLLSVKGKGSSVLQKPDKIYLENTNISFMLKGQPDIGSVRETFMFNQLTNCGFKIHLPQAGDFIVDNLHIEVGGKTKTATQVKDQQHYIIAADNIETGIGTKIPLWLFGFMY